VLVQLVIDIAALGALVAVTGGAFNPFVSLFLLPIVFAAATMAGPALAGVAVVATGAYSGLLLLEADSVHQTHVANVDMHIWGMWYGFLLSTVCVALFVARLSRRLRDHDRELARLREDALATERLLALGTLAAGTAHELGTPLATLAVVADELDVESDACERAALVAQMHAQIERCRAILSEMAAVAGNRNASTGHAVAVATWLDQIVSGWRERHPEIDVHYVRSGARATIVADRVVAQAIVNVLDNAGEAAARGVQIEGHWTARELELDIRDDGTGISAEVAARLGREILTTKPRGLGIGVMLARNIVERLGGELRIARGAEHGTHAHIRVPLFALDAP